MIEPVIPRRGVERGPSVFREKIEGGEVAQVHEEHVEEGEPAQAIEEDDAVVLARGAGEAAAIGYHSMTELAQVSPPPKTTMRM